MNTRLLQFLAAENITQAQLADSIDVARASISHILSGRNKPSFDFIQSIGQHYPELNLEWLITGKGKMYKNSSQNNQSLEKPQANEKYSDEITLFDEEISTFDTSNNKSQSTINETIKQQKSTKDKPHVQAISHNTAELPANKKITKIVVFFDDNTFQELGTV